MSSAPSPSPPPSTAAWILEFVLRQPIPDHLVHAILLALPLPSPHLPARLSKLILLRRLSTDLYRRSLSPRTLQSLELIHHLSRPLPASAPMRRAYCAVAVHCTLRTNFPAALDTIWNRRIGDLQRSDATGLAGEDVRCWRAVLEESVENEELRRMLADRMTEDAALESVRAYLKHEMDAMGPPFLQLAAERFPSPAARGEEPVGVAMNVDAPPVNHHDRNTKVTSVEMAVETGASFACRKSRGRDTIHTKHSVVDLTTELDGIGAGRAANDAQQSMAQDKFRGHEAANDNTAQNQERCLLSKFDRLPAQEVLRVSEALKSSCANLAIAVEDPLPAVLTTASIVIESRSSKAKIADKPQECHDQEDGKGPLGMAKNTGETQGSHIRIEVNDPVSAAETGTNVPHPRTSGGETVCNTDSVAVQLSRRSDPGPSDLKELEGNKDTEAGAREESLGEGNNAAPRKGTGTILRENKSYLVPKPSIMQQNPTAHPFQWVEDSIDSSTENLPSPSKKRALPSFKRRDVSPLKLAEIKKLNIQRKKKKWSLLEEATLRKAVEKYGVGNWKYILSSYNEIFENRMPGDLKDKWRNMTKN